MRCSEKAIMHDLFKEGKFINLEKLDAFVLGKFLDSDTNLNKTSIKVCPHCKLTNLLWSSRSQYKLIFPDRKPYSKSPKTTPHHISNSVPVDFSGINQTLFSDYRFHHSGSLV